MASETAIRAAPPRLRQPMAAPLLRLVEAVAGGEEMRRAPLVLITGHPRSGTHFTAKTLRRLGYAASIEGRWMCGYTGFVSSWKHAQPGRFRNRHRARRMRQDFDRILHQVRHPLDVIASSTTLTDRTIDHIKKYVDIPEPTVSHDQPLTLCMRSWIGWNRLIERRADWRFRLEDLAEDFPAFCRQAGIPERAWPELGARNCRSHAALNWRDLERADAGLAAEVQAMARRYGYDD